MSVMFWWSFCKSMGMAWFRPMYAGCLFCIGLFSILTICAGVFLLRSENVMFGKCNVFEEHARVVVLIWLQCSPRDPKRNIEMNRWIANRNVVHLISKTLRLIEILIMLSLRFKIIITCSAFAWLMSSRQLLKQTFYLTHSRPRTTNLCSYNTAALAYRQAQQCCMNRALSFMVINELKHTFLSLFIS